jgi:hypothetical protein
VEASRFGVLKQIEPSVVEITKEDYEERMGIRPEGQAGQKGKDVREPMGENPEVETITPLSDSRTRKELIEVLKKRGFAVGALNRKIKSQLIEMI